MSPDLLSELREVERCFGESRAEAERLLPVLLDLSGPSLSREIERHPKLRLGIVQALLAVAEKALERSPERAHQLTIVAIEHAHLDVPPSRASIARNLQGQAWAAHASALRGIGKYAEARAAIGVALDFYRAGLINVWHIATAQLIEAQILHDQGERAEALRRIRHAARDILLHGDREWYVQARMTEASMHWDASHYDAAADVWRATAEEAEQQCDVELLAFMKSRVGVFELQHGSVERAARYFSAALEAFESLGLIREANRARWRLAESAAARGRFHEAISEYYKVQALLFAEKSVVDAAVVSAKIVELLLLTGRSSGILPLVESLVVWFTEAGLRWNAMPAWTFVAEQARTGGLTQEHIAAVHYYFEDLPLRPNAPFIPELG